MKKLLIMTNSLYGGGAEKILQTLLEHINVNEFDVTLYSVIKDDIRKYNSSVSYRYIYDNLTDKNFINKFFVKIDNKIKLFIYNRFSENIFYKLFVKGEYDVEIAFIEGYSTRIISGSNNSKSRKYAWVHTDLSQNHWSEIAYKDLEHEKVCYNKYNRIYCVSTDVKNGFDKLFKLNTKSYVQHNPIDNFNIINLSKKFIPNDILIIKNTIRFITIGRLVKQKGYDRLLRVVKKLINEGYEFSLNILGEGEEKDDLSNFVTRENLCKYVKFLGYKSNPYPYILYSDIFICSSRTEGYSTVVCESIILNVPIVSTDCSGAKEILDGSKCGIIVENSETGLYYGLKKVLDSPKLIKLMQEETKQISKKFNIDNAMHEIEGIINE